MQETVRIGDAEYSRPFPDHELRPMVSVVDHETGDRFVTYAVTQEVTGAWAEVDTFGRQLTDADL
jgi:hypothetical protein